MSGERYIGEVQVWPLAVIPPNWALCDGRQLSREDYPALFSLIGFKFGGDGINNFALPDLRGRTPVGATAGPEEPLLAGSVGGSSEIALAIEEIPTHSHPVQASKNVATAATIQNGIPATIASGDPQIYAVGAYPDVTIDHATVAPAGGGMAHNNMQPSLGLNFIIALYGQYPDWSQE